MLKISYKIKIGNTTITEGTESNLLEMQVSSSFNIPVNHCHLTLTLPEKVNIKLDETISIEIGYDGTTHLIFTGKIKLISWEMTQVKIEGFSSLENLIIAHINSVYEKSSAGDIVKDILKEETLKADKVDNGIIFSSYVVGDLMSAYDHLKQLAQYCGFDCYANIEDKIMFAKYQAKTTHELNYGEDILSLTLHQYQTTIGKVEIYGESPASQGQGEKGTSWLTKKEVKGTAGKQSGTTLRLANPTARTQSIAQTIADNMLTNLSQKQRGKSKVRGNSQIKLGDGIKISKMPNKQQNGTFKVTGVHHHLNRLSGFCSVIDWEEP